MSQIDSHDSWAEPAFTRFQSHTLDELICVKQRDYRIRPTRAVFNKCNEFIRRSISEDEMRRAQEELAISSWENEGGWL